MKRWEATVRGRWCDNEVIYKGIIEGKDDFYSLIIKYKHDLDKDFYHWEGDNYVWSHSLLGAKQLFKRNIIFPQGKIKWEEKTKE